MWECRHHERSAGNCGNTRHNLLFSSDWLGEGRSLLSSWHPKGWRGSNPRTGANLKIKVYFCGSLLDGEAAALVVAVVGSNPATGANLRVCELMVEYPSVGGLYSHDGVRFLSRRNI